MKTKVSIKNPLGDLLVVVEGSSPGGALLDATRSFCSKSSGNGVIVTMAETVMELGKRSSRLVIGPVVSCVDTRTPGESMIEVSTALAQSVLFQARKVAKDVR